MHTYRHIDVDLHRWKLKKEEHIGWDSGTFCCLSSQPPFSIYPSFTQVGTYLSFYVTRPSISHQSISIHESCPSYSVDFGNGLQPFFRFIILDTHPPYFTLSTRESFLSFSASLCLINALSFIELRLPRLPMTALHLASCLTGTEGLQAHVSQTVQPSGSCGAELS